MSEISIIIPLAPHETELKELVKTLKNRDDIEIIVVSSIEQKDGDGVRNIKSAAGRAQAMNAGAKAAKSKFLWFLHADTQLTNDNIESLQRALKENSDALYYFNLLFDNELSKMKINNYGVWFRSHILGVPFGDQGFCIKKDYFDHIGGYPEQAPYGEDHLFVWYARQYGLPLRCTGTELVTSSRKYQQEGWLKITLLFQYRWIKQAFPEWVKLLQFKWGKGQSYDRRNRSLR